MTAAETKELIAALKRLHSETQEELRKVQHGIDTMRRIAEEVQKSETKKPPHSERRTF